MLGRNLSLWKRVLVVAALLLFLGCSKNDREKGRSDTGISESQALEISRKAAEKHGYDLRRYTLDTFGDSTSGDGKQWLFVYLCAPSPPPPGCSFLVAVDRKTGSASVHPGE
ncbi:hypothetical protein [Lysobacter gummosus]|jgi:hypothetical protein|uniref:Lipoprotein n=1 Tax=Lysobacter gummosus TaxID=262324 RepID=A0ABY3XFG6_9GAMM|nr:hypothetical protein [Lysobacter gummosus]UNP30382.1 hypothetical protein MOV92_03640 [Lysobacter gummosus]